jgi:hypothetical protein
MQPKQTPPRRREPPHLGPNSRLLPSRETIDRVEIAADRFGEHSVERVVHSRFPHVNGMGIVNRMAPTISNIRS